MGGERVRALGETERFEVRGSDVLALPFPAIPTQCVRKSGSMESPFHSLSDVLSLRALAMDRGRVWRCLCLGWLCLTLGACSPTADSNSPAKPPPGSNAPAATPASVPPERRAHSADSARTSHSGGPVELGRVDNGFRRIPIPLGSDHGFLVMNDGDEEHPSPLVAVGFRHRSKVITCRSIPEFEAALRDIPAGSTLHRHDRCLRPASTGLSDAFLEGVEQALARSGIPVAPDPVITCLCGR